MGYLGGGILLALNLAFFIFSEDLGVPGDLAVRIDAGWDLGGSAFPLLPGRVYDHTMLPDHSQGETYVSVRFQTIGKHFPRGQTFP